MIDPSSLPKPFRDAMERTETLKQPTGNEVKIYKETTRAAVAADGCQSTAKAAPSSLLIGNALAGSNPQAKRKPQIDGKDATHTEVRFWELLKARVASGEFSEAAFEPFSLPVEGESRGRNCLYTPDFCATRADPLFIATINDLKRVSNASMIDFWSKAREASKMEEFGRLRAFWPLCVFFEVKGGYTSSRGTTSRQKFRQARERYPWARFEMHQWKDKQWKDITPK